VTNTSWVVSSTSARLFTGLDEAVDAADVAFVELLERLSIVRADPRSAARH